MVVMLIVLNLAVLVFSIIVPRKLETNQEVVLLIIWMVFMIILYLQDLIFTDI